MSSRDVSALSDISSVRALLRRVQVSSSSPRRRGRLKNISAPGCVCVMLLPSMAEDAAMAAGVQRMPRPAKASLLMAVIGRHIEEKPCSHPDATTGDRHAACQTAGHTALRCTTLPITGGEQKPEGPRQRRRACRRGYVPESVAPATPP
jgi:hypothetical protein